MDKRLKIGFNSFDSDILENRPRFTKSVESGKGVDFVLCHVDPYHFPVEEACGKAEEVAKKLEDLGVDLITNFEFQNFSYNCTAPDGFDWANHPDNTHRLNIPEEYIEALKNHHNFVGMMYDEFEHTIINNNLSIILASKGKKRLPVFPLSRNAVQGEQAELLDEQLAEYVGSLRAMGCDYIAGEHVFPVLFHAFARNGITPNFKSQKESISNVQFAVAAGAALQYGTQLWNCVDLWFRNTYPGHSPKEMFYNLMFAYYAGVDRVYVEHCNAFASDDGEMTDYGKFFEKFSQLYKDRERNYDISDYRPEIGIIRPDDGFWGQSDPIMWRPMLMGNPKIKPGADSYEWIQAFNLITHGESNRVSLSWDKISPTVLRPHFSFASMNSAAVFDEKAKPVVLESLKLCFICGRYVSSSTLAAVEELVKENGLTAVISPRLAPEYVKLAAGEKISEIRDGKGAWIVTEDFSSKALRDKVSRFLGKKGEIRLTFRGKTVRLTLAKDRNSFVVTER